MSVQPPNTGEIDHAEDNDVYEFPLSPAQSALWFINQLAPESPAYNIPVCVRIVGELNQDALQKSLDFLVQRHEIFRTNYGNTRNGSIQLVQPQGQCSLLIEDLSGLDADAMEKSLDKKLVLEASRPFDLRSGPVLRANLFILSNKEFCLLINVHHICVDHSAMCLCIKQLESLYRCFSNNEEPDLPEQELQYADYVIWLKEQADPEALANKIEVWKKRLQGFSGVLNLPQDKPRPAVSSLLGAQYLFETTPAISAAVKAFSKSQSVSLYVSLLSAFKVLLHRYCQQDDVIVATPFANRGDQEELENVVGCFINTLPLATDFSAITDFSSLITSVKAVMLEAYENQSVPLDAIVDALKPKRDQSYNPLFQVGFIFQEPPTELHLPGLECQTLPLHSGGAMYDFHVWMWEDGEKLAGLVWYNTDIYSEKTIASMMENFQILLASLVADCNRDIRRANILSPKEISQLARWNQTDIDYRRDESSSVSLFENADKQYSDGPGQVLGEKKATSKEHNCGSNEAANLSELLTSSANQCPDSIAVTCNNEVLTYADLEAKSTKLAGYLVSIGVKPGDFVGICHGRSVSLLVGLLGIMKTGAAYVPLDPDYPNDRLLYMLEQSAVKVLVTEAALEESLPAFACEKVLLDKDWESIDRCNRQVKTGPNKDSLMYVIFTSGSTGLPKGVQVPHRSVVNFLLTMARQPGLSASDRLLAVTTLSFDIAVLELYLPLLVGACVVLADREQAGDGERLLELVAEQSVSVMQATPSTWRLLIAAGWQGSKNFKALCGGEAFPRDLASELVSRAGTVWNMYGPTETTVWSTCYQIKDAGSPIFIGKPIGNTQCYVVNDAMQLQPVGVAGELYIGGNGVTDGYLGRDDLTAERFVDDIFRPQVEGARLYRTGDLVRWQTDGNLEYLNRIDNQVKVRGFRIELGEIEQTLLKLDNVVGCVVTVAEYNETDKRLVGYVQFKDGESMTSSDVRRYLRENLPDYMILQHLVELDSIPLTPNGKIDRKALPDPFHNYNQVDDYIAPSSEVEKKLAEIWARVIGIEKVSADSNFFEIGGHSLLALEVIYQIEEVFGHRLNIQDVLMDSLEQIALKLPMIETNAQLDDVDDNNKNNDGFAKRLLNKLTGK